MHECVCVALSRVCLLLLLCVCEIVFCVSVHAYVCVDVDGWVRWRFFFATSNLKSVCSLSLNILLVYLCVCVCIGLFVWFWFLLNNTRFRGIFCADVVATSLLWVYTIVSGNLHSLVRYCSLRSRLPLSKRGNNGHGEPFHRRKCAAGGQTEVDQSFFLFCFIVLSKKQQHRHFIQSFR